MKIVEVKMLDGTVFKITKYSFKDIEKTLDEADSRTRTITFTDEKLTIYLGNLIYIRETQEK